MCRLATAAPTSVQCTNGRLCDGPTWAEALKHTRLREVKASHNIHNEKPLPHITPIRRLIADINDGRPSASA